MVFSFLTAVYKGIVVGGNTGTLTLLKYVCLSHKSLWYKACIEAADAAFIYVWLVVDRLINARYADKSILSSLANMVQFWHLVYELYSN